ncbi:MAG: hypothetical protein J6W10_04390 [Kiritimatiellae bacterium]|nr:hypothetical protein [Kiritimatiellia bacterium]
MYAPHESRGSELGGGALSLSDTSAARFSDCAAERGARRGGGIPPTKDSAQRNAAKAQGATARGARAWPTLHQSATSTRSAMRGLVRGRSRAHRGRLWRVAQDSTPKAYMYTSSGSMDAQIAQAT